MILSIIIPVFNVEKYIRKCITSCINQNIPNNYYEIIVVNDGTQDNSLCIIQEITKKYSNIKIINQENKGLSVARNVGLKHSKGKYVWFIDADDYIEENCLGRITSLLNNDLDILQLQYRLVYEHNLSSINIPFYQINGRTTGIEIVKKGGLPVPAPFSIYRSAFLKENNLEFYKGIYHEDSEFKPKATYLAKKITSDTLISYNYLQRNTGSITSSFKLKHGLDILTVINSLIKFANKQNMPYRYKKYFYINIGLNINSLLYGFHKLNNTDKLFLINKLRENKRIFLYMTITNKMKYKLEGLIFYLNINLGLILHKIIRNFFPQKIKL